ncbi:hypothetical protein GSI_01176 [Ganoderma sinense ZZ0214-1]|uniref:Uncharacterized protein n=1 Tax=Ganoderma sinense ZZ0214-1 TaxID=1077348 RepID=A0A2G8SUS9_9APHY|nr:hypothetical protein GSI_01176 [Ganoderma sinense ZZ0214-1]
MSRPEPHGQDYDHPHFDHRAGGEHGLGAQDFPSHLRDYISRDGLRDPPPGSRDMGPQEYGSTTFYNSSYSSSPPPPPFTADRRPLASNAMSGAGFSSFVGPRMLTSPQGIGVGAGGNWNSKPASFSVAPNVGRPPGEGGGGVSSQVQQSVVVSPLALNQHHRPSPPRGLPELYTSPLLASTPPFPDRDNRDAFFNHRPRHSSRPVPSPSSSLPRNPSPSLLRTPPLLLPVQPSGGVSSSPGWTRNTPSRSVTSWVGTPSRSRSPALPPIPLPASRRTIPATAF